VIDIILNTHTHNFIPFNALKVIPQLGAIDICDLHANAELTEKYGSAVITFLVEDSVEPLRRL
jgi:hypothetical protein